jgi:hypothetical protein
MNLPVARCPLTLPSAPLGKRVAEGRAFAAPKRLRPRRRVRGWFKGSMCELFRGILSLRERVGVRRKGYATVHLIRWQKPSNFPWLLLKP